MGKPDVSDKQGPLTVAEIRGVLGELFYQLSGRKGRIFLERLNLWLKGIDQGKKPHHVIYRTPGQECGLEIRAGDVLDELHQRRIVDRTVSADHPMVKRWIADPHTYPYDLKGMRVFLWGDVTDWSDDIRYADPVYVYFLVWNKGRVELENLEVGYVELSYNDVTLLIPK